MASKPAKKNGTTKAKTSTSSLESPFQGLVIGTSVASSSSSTPVPSSASSSSKKEDDDETIVAERLKEVNEWIGLFRRLGYKNDVRTGLLYKPEKVELKPTGIKAKIIMKDPPVGFFLDVGSDRSGNQLIHQLAGRFVRYSGKPVWSFHIAKLEEVRKYFSITEETQAAPKADNPMEKTGTVTYKEMGDAILVAGDTRPHLATWRALKGKWNDGSEGIFGWTFKEEKKKEALAALRSLEESGQIKKLVDLDAEDAEEEEETPPPPPKTPKKAAKKPVSKSKAVVEEEEEEEIEG